MTSEEPAVPAVVDQAELDDLRRRLDATRRVPLPAGHGWSRGTEPDYLADLLRDWRDYDWRPHEQRLRALPWVLTGAGDRALRAVHQRAGGDAPAVLLLHGWPDSFLRYERVLPLLTDLDVVVPCLPGYPWAAGPPGSGLPATEMAEVVAGAMAELGHRRYVVSGGDIGSGVAEALAAAHPDRVAALHLTNVPAGHLQTDPGDLTEEERRYLDAGRAWQQAEGAYAHQQATKPHTLAVGLNDSPAGLAAWVVEKLRSWSDCDGDVEAVWPRPDLLTWLTVYWLSGTIGTSFTPYVERGAPPGRVEVPTVVTSFPLDLVYAPRRLAERVFDLRVWDEEPSGGHFAAWERPEAFVAGLRKAVELG
jgi:pimeloyl-ACP methyl ester carboxylesterase